MKRTTLQSRIRKLGIQRPVIIARIATLPKFNVPKYGHMPICGQDFGTQPATLSVSIKY